MANINERNETQWATPPSIVILTDFGDATATGQCVLAAERTFKESGNGAGLPRIHSVGDLFPYDIIGGAFSLIRLSKQASRDSVFVTVVDPGVGTERKIIAVRTNTGSTLIGPDNGVLWPTIRRDGVASAHIVDPSRFTNVTSTFHGRDVMAPAAGLIAGGTAIEELGEQIEESRINRLRVPHGRVLLADGNFGNIKVWAGVPDEAGALAFRNGHVDMHRVPVAKTFGDVRVGESLAYNGSDGLLEIAVREGSAAEKFDIRQGTVLDLKWE